VGGWLWGAQQHTVDVSKVGHRVKIVASVFLKKEGISLVDFLEKGITIKSERYEENLKQTASTSL
jgi:hypothetical protein